MMNPNLQCYDVFPSVVVANFINTLFESCLTSAFEDLFIIQKMLGTSN